MEIYISVVLTLLTIATGVLTVKSYYDSKKKDSNKQGKDSGAVEQKLNDIYKRTEEIQKDVRELREKDRATALLALQAQESAKSAHKRIDRIERERSVALRKDA